MVDRLGVSTGLGAGSFNGVGSREFPRISAKQLKASICRDSFFDYVQHMWHAVIPEKPVWNWHIHYICNEMQVIAERVFRNEPKEYDLCINVPPGSTKSTICSVMFPTWVWTNMPSAWTICGSYSYTLSLELSRLSRDVVQSDEYRELFGDLELRSDQNTKGYFVNQHAGGRFATSIGGTITGFHGHFLVVDDPLNPEEAVSAVELKRANDWITQTLFTRKKDKVVTPTILIMQRLHEGDPTAEMLKKAARSDVKVRHICLPADINKRTEKTVRPRSLRRRYTPDPDQEGSSLMDPVRMDRTVLNEAQASLMDYGYSGQFGQSPSPPSGGIFKIDKFRLQTPPSSWLQRCRFWDKAGTEGGGAYTAGVKMGEDREGRFWILDVVREQLDSGAREELILMTAEMDGTDIIVGVEQEPGSGGKESAEGTVRNLSGFVVEVVRPTGDKTIRARPFSSQVNIGNVYLVPGEWNADYIEELKLFDRGKYKDQVDASSGAFTVLKFPVGRIGVI